MRKNEEKNVDCKSKVVLIFIRKSFNSLILIFFSFFLFKKKNTFFPLSFCFSNSFSFFFFLFSFFSAIKCYYFYLKTFIQGTLKLMLLKWFYLYTTWDFIYIFPTVFGKKNFKKKNTKNKNL